MQTPAQAEGALAAQPTGAATPADQEFHLPAAQLMANLDAARTLLAQHETHPAATSADDESLAVS